MASLTTTFNSFTVETRLGGSGSTWQDPSNAQSENGLTSNYSIPGGGGGTLLSQTSHYLVCANTNDKVPNLSTIDGLLLRIKKSKYNSTPFLLNVFDESVFFDYLGSQSENKAKTSENYPLTLTFSTYGSSSDKWSLNPTYDMVNSENFKLKFAIDLQESHPGSIGTGQIDVFELTIYYTPPSPVEGLTSRVFLIT